MLNRAVEGMRILENLIRQCQNILPDTSAERLKLLENLASLKAENNEHEEALRLFNQVLAIRKAAIGDEHPLSLETMLNIAREHTNFSNFAEAKDLLEHVLTVRRKNYGVDADETLNVLSSLSYALLELNEVDSAAENFTSILNTYERTYGPNHEKAIRARGNLARTLIRQENFLKAKELLELNLEIEEHIHGPEHLAVCFAARDLAWFFIATGEYTASRSLLERALIISTASDTWHDTVVISNLLSSLAETCEAIGDYVAAANYRVELVKNVELDLGPDHPSVLRGMQETGVFMRDTDQLTDAESMLREVLKRQTGVSGAESLEVASVLSALGVLLKLMGNCVEAEVKFRQSLLIRERELGPDAELTRLVRGRLKELLGQAQT